MDIQNDKTDPPEVSKLVSALSPVLNASAKAITLNRFTNNFVCAQRHF